jgi:hypothetical protein
MPDRIPFPTSPDDGDFYTDGNDLRWQYSEFKRRWSLTPLAALTSAFTSSESPPSNTDLQWFDPSDGSLSIWVEESDAWVVVSGTGNDGEDLTSVAEIVTIDTATHELITANIDQYCRFTYAGPVTVTLPVIDDQFAAVTGNIITLRNSTAAANVTLTTPGLSVTLLFAVGADVIAPRATAQIICVDDSTNTWEIL